jgi:hypothetical protein
VQRIRGTPYRALSTFSEQFLQREAVDTVACFEFHETFFRLPSTLEAHHLLHRGFTLFRDGALLFCQFGAFFTQFLLLAFYLNADEFIDLFAAAFARCHPGLLPEIPPRANTLRPAVREWQRFRAGFRRRPSNRSGCWKKALKFEAGAA